MLSISEIQEKLTPIFENSGINKAILFGSYALGIATANSDVDLWIDDEGLIRGLQFYGLRAELEEAISKNVDLLIERDIIPNSKIDIEIKENGMIIYERAN